MSASPYKNKSQTFFQLFGEERRIVASTHSHSVFPRRARWPGHEVKMSINPMQSTYCCSVEITRSLGSSLSAFNRVVLLVSKVRK